MEKLNCESLMIGDYAFIKPSGMLIKIAAVHHNKVAYHAVINKLTWVRESLLEPIPLTPEILEKNEFYYGYTSYEEDLASNTIAQLSENNKGWCWDEGAGAIKVIFPNEADGGLLSLDDQSFDRHLEMVFGGIIFVHELQHVLRLCRIKKEIIL